MTLTVQSVRSVGFGVLIEQILCGENFMLIGPQENVSLNPLRILEIWNLADLCYLSITVKFNVSNSWMISILALSAELLWYFMRRPILILSNKSQQPQIKTSDLKSLISTERKKL